MGPPGARMASGSRLRHSKFHDPTPLSTSRRRLQGPGDGRWETRAFSVSWGGGVADRMGAAGSIRDSRFLASRGLAPGRTGAASLCPGSLIALASVGSLLAMLIARVASGRGHEEKHLSPGLGPAGSDRAAARAAVTSRGAVVRLGAAVPQRPHADARA